MGSKQAAAKRAPAAKRTTGQRKTAKKKEDPVTSTPVRPRPKPRPLPRLRTSAVPPIDAIPEEDEPVDETHDISMQDIADSFHLDPTNALSGFEPGLGEDLLANVDYNSEDSSDDSDTSIRKFLTFFPVFFFFFHTTNVKHAGRPAIDITFEVPYKNASRDLIIKSNISFASFLTQTALKMETSVLHLSQVGYILPWKIPRTGKPVAKLLEDEESYKLLIKNIFDHIDEQKAKNRGKGKVKPFTIQIVDTGQQNANSKVNYSICYC
jgi:hypothetical protein